MVAIPFYFSVFPPFLFFCISIATAPFVLVVLDQIHQNTVLVLVGLHGNAQESGLFSKSD